MMSGLISICIPTFNRPSLLMQAIESCFAQRHPWLELLIGDDSANAETAQLVTQIKDRSSMPIDYERNHPPLGQSANVNRLFDRAKGERLILLHDDDLLCPNGLDALEDIWRKIQEPICVYGQQVVMDPDGLVLERQTQSWNERYFRTSSFKGPQTSMLAAMRQQVPNNCYLMKASIARAVRYRSETEVGQSVDAEFILRLAATAREGFVFVDMPISKYRLTPLSIARNEALNRREDLFFEAALRVVGDPSVDEAKVILLSRISVGAALDAAMIGRRRFALKIIFSRFYTKPLMSRLTIYRLCCVVSPRWSKKIRTWIKTRIMI